MNKLALVRLAFEARRHSYSPYSGFCVGAALLVGDGSVYQGANVENAAFSPSVCAERVAALQAIYAGERDFRALAIVGYPQNAGVEEREYAFPCGVCRQFLREFSPPEMPSLIARTESDFIQTTFADLLPHSFGPENLNRKTQPIA